MEIDEWRDESGVNDLGPNPDVYRCPFHEAQNVYRGKTPVDKLRRQEELIKMMVGKVVFKRKSSKSGA